MTDLRRRTLMVPEFVGSLPCRCNGRKVSSIGYHLSLTAEAPSIRLRYTLRSTKALVDYPVRVVSTACYLGGKRWWFCCPLNVNGVACGRRVRKLYLHGRYFGCRSCHRLTYRATQESDSRVYAAARRGMDFSEDVLAALPISKLVFATKVIRLVHKQTDRRERAELEKLRRLLGRRD